VKRPKEQRYERYDFKDSPWVQNLTQRDLANLLGTSKDRLEAIVNDKDKWISRRVQEIGRKRKLRELAVPTGKLRQIHERLKFHLNKIKQPTYLFSPRKGHSQRDNAAEHLGQNHFLSLDIRQFYPSTTSEHVFQWAHKIAGLRPDVAGLLTHLVTIDGKMPFGSPISPVLTTHVHRRMFDRIYDICEQNNLRMSLWVDDLTISGNSIRGELVEEFRSVVRSSGFQTHKIRFRTGARPVTVTGVPIEGERVIAPKALHMRVHEGYEALRAAELSDADRMAAIDTLLSALGTYRYYLGPSSPEGRQASNRMHALRQRRAKLKPISQTKPNPLSTWKPQVAAYNTELPWS